MTEEELEKLRGYYHALLGQQKVFEDAYARNQFRVEDSSVRVLVRQLRSIEKDFPGLLPTFEIGEFYDGKMDRRVWYKVAGIRSHIAVAVGTLISVIETSARTPVTEVRDFSFVNDPELCKILERDYSEIQRAYISKCWKSVIILSGGAIEAILTDLLLQDAVSARSASKAPIESDITKWGLADLISVSVELGIVSPSVEKLSHSVRDYRNLVHPGKEIREKLRFDEEEARIALEVFHILHRELLT